MKRTVAQRLFALLAATGLLFAAVAVVSADAGNPILGTIQSSSEVHPDGSVTVYVRGEWNWLSHNNDCNFDRAATGVGIIWNDPTEPGYTVTKGAISAGVGISSLRPGDVVNTVDRMVHPVDRGNVPQGYTAGTYQNTGDGYPVNAAGDWPKGQLFVDPTTNTAAPGATEVAAWKGGCGREPLSATASKTGGTSCGNATTTCEDHPWGSWGYEKNDGVHTGYKHTFASVADVTSVCVNFYDVHGGGDADEDKFQVPNKDDEITVDGNGDNSIQTNAFNVANGQNCIGLVPVPDIHIVKTATPTTLPFGGGSVTYTYDVTNTGNVLLSNVTVTDDKCATPAQLVPTNTLGGDTNGDGKLAVSGETWHFSCTTNITLTTTNIGTAHGFFGATQVTDTDTATVTVATGQPHLAIVKTATEANYDSVGDIIHYTIVATNDGTLPLAAATVTDPNATGLVCVPANGSALGIGASMTCTASHTVVQADIEAGHYLNTACVDDGAGGAAEVCDDADVPAVKNPHLAINKVATEANYDSVGDIIHYTIVATNDGNTTIASATVTDTLAVGLVCVPANGSPLAPGASLNCTATHTVTQADIDAGHYLNTACVDDGVAAGGAAQVCDDADVPSVKNPHLAINKVATEANYDSVGDIIHYTIVATNDGNTTIASATVTDTLAVGLVCVPANGSPLAPGASLNCTATHTVTQADIDAGHYLNTACVDDGVAAGGAAQVCDDADVPSVKNPHLAINKVATEANYDSVGDIIHYTIVATNDGNTTIASATVTDTLAVGLVCVPANGSPLAPGASLNCTATHTVTQADIDAGHYLNTACVDDGVAAGGAAQVCDDVDVPSSNTPHLSIVKTSSTANYNAVGQTITYTITATNDGNITLNNVTITDALATLGTCTPVNGSSLAPGATLVCAATHVVTQADIDAGHYLNAACVDDGAGPAAQACDDVDVPGLKNPLLAITKVATETTYNAVGQILHYTIVATNTGNTTIASATITDPNAVLGTCTPVNGSTLAPGATITCTATHTVVQADITAGHYLNVACVNDGPGGAAEVCANKDIPVPPPVVIPPSPSIALTKTANPTSLPVGGGSVTYTYHITNPSTVTLSNVTLVDDKCSPVTRVSGDTNTNNLLEPGENWTYTCTTTITATTTNTAVATGTGNGTTVTATAQATVTVAAATPTATPTPTPTPTGTVAGATSRPRITLPPTDGVNTGSGGSSDGLPIILLVLIGLAAFAPIAVRAKAQRR